MQHRADVDGLRAVAVLLVIALHADVQPFSGGFVGVDVFFVISGYLITRIIVGEIERGRFSIARFYERRARRILPAFFAMAGCVWVASLLLLMPSDLQNFSRSLLAAAFSGSNILFWHDAGYFDAPSALKPLLHTWSLGVEEQFYLLLPAFLLLLTRLGGSRSRKGVLVLLTCLSFLLSVICTSWRPALAFYLLPSRAWELLLGSLLAIGAVPLPGRGRSAEITAALGLALILLAGVAYSSATRFPGVAALLPTVGAALVLATAETTATGRALSWAPLVTVGKISYSLYLWHWPLLALARYAWGPALSASLTAALVATAFGLAWLSWRFVETPFRRPSWEHSPRRALAAAACMTAAFAALGAFGVGEQGLPGRLNDSARRYAALQDKTPYDRLYDRRHCFLDIDQPYADYDSKACATFDDARAAKTALLVVGDSFAAHLVPGLMALAPSRLEVRQATASSCAPLLRDDARCDRVLRHFMAEVLPASTPDVLLLSADWKPVYAQLGASGLRERLRASLLELQRRAVPLVLVGQSPTFEKPVPELLARQAQLGAEVPEVLRADDNDLVNSVLESLARELALPFLNPYQLACHAHRCLVASGQDVFHWDYGHLTAAGSKFYDSALLPLIMQARGHRPGAGEASPDADRPAPQAAF